MKIINLNSIESAVKHIRSKKVGFELNPLDMNIAKMQFNLQKRAIREIPEHGDFAPLVEKYTSKDPTLNISQVEVVCQFLNKDVPKKTQRSLEINVTDKSGINSYNYVLAQGDKNEIINAINKNDFLELCKSVTLSVDEGIK